MTLEGVEASWGWRWPLKQPLKCFRMGWDEGSSRKWLAALAKAVGGEAWGRCAAGAGCGSPVTEAWCLTPSHLLCNSCFVMLLFKEQCRRPAPSTSFSSVSVTVGILRTKVAQPGNTEGLVVLRLGSRLAGGHWSGRVSSCVSPMMVSCSPLMQDAVILGNYCKLWL